MKSKRKYRIKRNHFLKYLKNNRYGTKTGLIKNVKEVNQQEKNQEQPESSQKKITFNAVSLIDLLKKNGETYITHRDDDIKAIFLCFMSEIRNNVLIIADKGSGKESIVFGIADKITKKECPNEFFDYDLILIDANDLSPSKYTDDESFAIIRALDDYLNQNPKTILYIRDMYKIFDYNLLDLFAPIFKKVNTIGTIDTVLFNSSVWNVDPTLSNTFEQLGLEPIKKEYVYDVLQNQIKKLEKTHGIEFPKDVFNYMVDINYMEQIGEINLLAIIEEAEWAILNAKCDLKKAVSKDTIIKIRKNKINTIKEYNPRKISHLAYHEAGHAIAGLEVGKNISGVVITPDEDFLGFAMSIRDKYPCETLDELRKSIIFLYGGTIGAQLFGFDIQDGDQNDIQNATKIAKNIITNFEMGELCRKRRRNSTISF